MGTNDLKHLVVSTDIHRQIKALAALAGFSIREYVEAVLQDDIDRATQRSPDEESKPYAGPDIPDEERAKVPVVSNRRRLIYNRSNPGQPQLANTDYRGTRMSGDAD